MRKALWLFLFFICALPMFGQVTCSAGVSDTFAGSSLSANWTIAPSGAVITVASNTASNTTSSVALPFYSGTTFLANQCAGVKFASTSGSGGPGVLMSGNGTGIFYASADGAIYSFTNGTFNNTVTSGCGSPNTTDTYALTALGGNIYLYDSTTSTLMCSGAIPSGFSSGSPGFFSQNGNAVSNFVGNSYDIPVLSPVGGTFTSSQSVTMTGDGSCGTIHYTTDGSAPTTSSPSYSTPITVSAASTIVKAICGNSPTAPPNTQVYTIVVPPPTISPDPTRQGGYTFALEVTITCTNPSSTVYYTTDGSTPTHSSPSGATPLSHTIAYTASPTTTQVNAICALTGYSDSTVATESYLIRAATTFYVRPDGGSRYSSVNPSGQCDGQGDAAYPGTGVNQHCAYFDPRMLWNDPAHYCNTLPDNTPGCNIWAIAGGDTAIIRSLRCSPTSYTIPPGGTSITLNGCANTITGLPTTPFYIYMKLSGYPTSTFLNGLTIEVTGTTSTSITGTFMYGQTETAGSATETGYLESEYQIGGTQTSGTNGYFGYGFGTALSMDTVPSGVSGQPTRILGENYGPTSCHTTKRLGTSTIVYGAIPDPKKTVKLWAGGQTGGSVSNAIAEYGSQWTDIECLEITDHSSCGLLADCNSSTDWAQNGINLGTGTIAGNISFTDIFIHGMESRGYLGSIGGPLNMTRVTLADNFQAGADFDGNEGGSTVNNGTFTAVSLGIEGNGCAELYPLSGQYSLPITNCRGQTTTGYGDGIGTPKTMNLSANIQNSWAIFNIQDGFDWGHAVGANTFVNNYFEGNGGGNIKVGPSLSALVYNNYVMANCYRMSEETIPIAPTNYGPNLGDGDLCRAGGDENGLNVLSNTQILASTDASGFSCTGTALTTGAGGTMLSQLTAGEYIGPGDATWPSGYAQITAVNSNTSATLSGSGCPTSFSNSALFVVPSTGPATVTTSILIYHNTFLGEGGIVLDMQCGVQNTTYGGVQEWLMSTDTSLCPTNPIILKDNLVQVWGTGGFNTGTPPSMFYGFSQAGTQDYNLYYNLKFSPVIGAHEKWAQAPLLVTNTVPNTLTAEANLDGFNAKQTSSSPSKYTGVSISGQTNDFYGAAWNSTPSMGAIEFVTATGFSVLGGIDLP